MRNDFSIDIGDDKLDFSGLNTLTPREDSWSKICERLDNQTADKGKNVIPFRMLSAIPLAASLVLVGISVMLTAIGKDEIRCVSMNAVTSAELSEWYGNLGQNTSDEFETLDKSITISYLMKE